MRNEPLISIILPTYNGSRFITQKIESCFSQTHKNWELIIVDDASTDNTPKILKQSNLSDPRIHCIRNRANLKLPASLNVGFTQASGRYLTWTSDDNYYRPEALKIMVDFLESHPEIDMVYTDFSIVDEENKPIKFKKVKHPKKLLNGNCVGPSFLYRRKVMDVIGQYSEDMVLAEDYDYWLRVSTQLRMMPLHKDLYCYRVHRHSLTSLGLDRRHRMTEKALARNIPLMRWSSSPEISESYTILSRIALNQHDWWAVQKYLIKALLNSPAFFFRYSRNVISRRLKNAFEYCFHS